LAPVSGVFAAGSVTVPLNAQNGSGVSGTATLTDMGTTTQVVVNVTGEPAGGAEPEHIHTGSCANLGGVKYPLANVVNGTATTVVNVSLASLQTGGFAINLHESAANISHYIACGDIPAVAAATTTTTAATTAATTTATAVPVKAPATGDGGLATTAAWPLAAIIAGGLGLLAFRGRKRSA
jgi:hypothetical protein